MSHRVARSVVAVALLAGGLAACGEHAGTFAGADPFKGRPAALTADGTPVMLYGGTYGPQGQFLTTGCLYSGSDWGSGTRTVTPIVLRPTKMDTIFKIRHVASLNSTDCHTQITGLQDASGQFYYGGDLIFDVASDGASGRLVTPATFSTSDTLYNFPSDGQGTLSFQLNQGYQFVDWVVVGWDNSQTRVTTPTLSVTPANVQQRYFLELMVSSGGGSGPPDTTCTQFYGC